jgi:signal transduction histidine kinase
MMSPELREHYLQALRKYLSSGGEVPLAEAYQIGRQALSSGHGLLEVINLHHASMSAIMKVAVSTEMARQVDASGRFLVECLSPFEMLQLGNKEANAALRRLNEILEEEAKRIAHALHDQAGQMLATVYLELAELARTGSESVRERVNRISEHLDVTRMSLRRLSHELRPLIIDELGLLPALRALADGVRQREAVEITVEGTTNESWPPTIETALYRTVQEALNNATRHGRASHAHIRVWTHESAVHCSIVDDGKGFDPGNHSRGLGLIGIQERIASLHGSVEIDSAPGKGTKLHVSCPLVTDW